METWSRRVGATTFAYCVVRIGIGDSQASHQPGFRNNPGILKRMRCLERGPVYMFHKQPSPRTTPLLMFPLQRASDNVLSPTHTEIAATQIADSGTITPSPRFDMFNIIIAAVSADSLPIDVVSSPRLELTDVSWSRLPRKRTRRAGRTVS